MRKIIFGDCIEKLKGMETNSIDLIVTDPPYNVSVENKKIKRTYPHYAWGRKKDINLDFGQWDRAWNSIEEYIEWTERWFKECARVLKEKSWIYIFFAKDRITYLDLLAQKYGLKTRQIYVWYKKNPPPTFSKVNWLNTIELIWVGSKGACKLRNFKRQRDMHNIYISTNRSIWGETDHPNEKHVGLLKHLIECSSNEGDLVLDPFAGSGSTAIACIESNRNFICIENNRHYYNVAKNRILKKLKSYRYD